jgi:hypothetical protein
MTRNESYIRSNPDISGMIFEHYFHTHTYTRQSIKKIKTYRTTPSMMRNTRINSQTNNNNNNKNNNNNDNNNNNNNNNKKLMFEPSLPTMNDDVERFI